MSGAVSTGWAPPSGPGEPPGPTRGWARWLPALTVVWAVLLGVLVWVSVRDDPPTVREQRDLAQAGPVVDRAVGELLAAVGDAGAVALAPARVTPGCRITPMEDGAALERAVAVEFAGDDVRGLLERVAARLPGDWRAGVRVTGEGARLWGDAGGFVAVRGRPAGPGRVLLTADTGCRPVGAGYRPPTASAGPEGAALADALRALGLPAAPRPELTAAPCPAGEGTNTRTVRATGPAPATLAALAPLAGDSTVRDTPEVYAWRSGAVSVVVERAGDEVRLAASTGCPA
ncbi:hypothetical protein [Micromonospora siamensis]|uniref:Uncharacterized protein n=1 Tax=Micromonospora siamensis TaxID=299152 RepID=A0A1C5GL35_9ACTN|nr:hypothetical protein [Micromonospora siamensis]SCG34518.1 hypothetical protein GA0074704_0079 [Micromonospora siamensis]